jgi:hypothetical protein
LIASWSRGYYWYGRYFFINGIRRSYNQTIEEESKYMETLNDCGLAWEESPELLRLTETLAQSLSSILLKVVRELEGD